MQAREGRGGRHPQGPRELRCSVLQRCSAAQRAGAAWTQGWVAAHGQGRDGGGRHRAKPGGEAVETHRAWEDGGLLMWETVGRV